MTASVFDVLVDSVLVVEPIGPDVFTGRRPTDSFDRIYGGETAAQGLRAAAATVAADRVAHSLHITFLRIGDPTRVVEYRVDRLRDSAHFSTRQVRATQDGRAIGALTVSFQTPWSALDYSAPLRIPFDDTPPPETLPGRSDALRADLGDDRPAVASVPWPIDIRYIDRYPWRPGPDPRPQNRMWVRGAGRLSGDPLEHAAVLTYASDLTMYEPVIYAHPGQLSWLAVSRGEIRGASLDHSIWFHRPFRADEWLLHEHETTAAHGARSLSTGRYYDRDGLLVASVAQELALFADARPDDRGDTA